MIRLFIFIRRRCVAVVAIFCFFVAVDFDQFCVAVPFSSSCPATPAILAPTTVLPLRVDMSLVSGPTLKIWQKGIG